jgi:formyltetrahydrofolate deformylase
MSPIYLKLSCPDRVGLLATICRYFAENGANLTEVHQFSDPSSQWFFTRMEIDPASAHGTETLRAGFATVAESLRGIWSLRNADTPYRVVLMVSKIGHCLADLLWRWRAGELPCNLVGVISNHEEFRPLVEREGLPFHTVPVDPSDKRTGFEKLEELWRVLEADYIVLARYMQILPPWLCERWPGRVINIHHSFLPSFVGANPYARAYERGVKLIGATCHYVTADLDEGPIIEQEVVRVEHFHSPDDLLRLGRDCERLALARGLRYLLTDRVLMRGTRTVVFRD